MPILRKKTIIGSPFCDFCATLAFERQMIIERCNRYNMRSHTKTGNPYSGVRIISYISDKRTRVVEKQSKSFSQLRFCPVCGYDYVEDKEFNGKKYKQVNDINKKAKKER